MKEAMFEYKCRRCGIVTQNPCTDESNANLVLITISLEQKLPPMLGGDVKQVSVHNCKDGGAGLSDLLGYAVRKDEKERHDQIII